MTAGSDVSTSRAAGACLTTKPLAPAVSARFKYDLDVVLQRQQRGQRTADEVLVVGEQDPDR